MKKLKNAELKSRRTFLKGLAKKSAVPAVIVYGVSKSTPPLFAR